MTITSKRRERVRERGREGEERGGGGGERREGRGVFS